MQDHKEKSDRITPAAFSTSRDCNCLSGNRHLCLAAPGEQSRTTGGPGTSVPPVELLLLPPDDELELLEELELDELLEEPDEVLPPKLEDPPVAPDEVLLELPPELEEEELELLPEEPELPDEP